MEQYARGPAEDGISLSNWKSDVPTIDESETNSSAGFECNICLDVVQDPVVTLCGHLYCWPCIYKWMHFQSAPSEIAEQQQPQCPVCKTELSKETLVPVYVPGATSPKSSDGKGPHLGIIIPQRPPSPRCGSHLNAVPSPTTGSRAVPQLHPRSHERQPLPYQYRISGSEMTSTTMRPGGISTNVVHVEMFDMILARLVGGSETTLHSYPNTYGLAGTSSPRMRRYFMRAERSHNRLSFFLCCCVIFCLLFF